MPGGMMGVSVEELLRRHDMEAKESKGREAVVPEKGGDGDAPLDRAEEMADNAAGDPALQAGLRAAAQAPVIREEERRREELEQRMLGKEPERKEKQPPGISKEVAKYQAMVAATVRGSLALKNVQRLLAVQNRDRIEKSMAKEQAAAKPAVKGQASTIQIPAVLLRHVMQEVGTLHTKMSQNDIMTGFLYWYFGRPDGVTFPSSDVQAHVEEVMENLDVNASPAKASRMNFNMSGSLLERMEALFDRMDSMAELMRILSKDSIGLKARSDKIYIALCYELLDRLAFLPPRGAGQRADALDMMGGGLSWSLMSSVDEAYEYFKDTNGRDIYKAKHGIKAASYVPPSYSSSSADSYQEPGLFYPDDGDAGDEEDYDDLPYADPLELDGLYEEDEGNTFYEYGVDDPEYDDGTEPGSEEEMRKRRAELDLYKRISAMEADEVEDGDG